MYSILTCLRVFWSCPGISCPQIWDLAQVFHISHPEPSYHLSAADHITKTCHKLIANTQALLHPRLLGLRLSSSHALGSSFPQRRSVRSQCLCLIPRYVDQSDVTELNWTELTQFRFWWTDQWANRKSPLVIGWRVREHSHVNHRRHWTVPTVMHYCLPVGQFVKNYTMSVQFSSVTLLCTHFKSSQNVLLHVFVGRPLLRVPPTGDHCISVLECRWLKRQKTWPASRNLCSATMTLLSLGPLCLFNARLTDGN